MGDERGIRLPYEKQLEDVNEEFNNFVHRATQVERIVRQMNASDERTQRMAMAEAERLLTPRQHQVSESMTDDDDVTLTVRSNRTLLNRRALCDDSATTGNSATSPEAFMAEVSRDADRRYQERRVRTERMETFKTQATRAFRRADYERALCCYTKAIEQIKDSPLLYNNRALTQMRLQRYDAAVADTEMALRLNATCVRAFALQAHAWRGARDLDACARTIERARTALTPSDYQQLIELVET